MSGKHTYIKMLFAVIPMTLFVGYLLLLEWGLGVEKAKENVSNQIAKGASVNIVGQVSDMPWQHMVDMREDYPNMAYIDFDDDQLVVYSKEPINCDGEVRLKGTVIEIEGGSKRPGSNEVYTELQLEADEAECL